MGILDGIVEWIAEQVMYCSTILQYLRRNK